MSRCVVELKARREGVRLVGRRGRRAEPAVLLRKVELMLAEVERASSQAGRRRRSDDGIVKLGLDK